MEVKFVEKNQFMIIGIEDYTKNDFDTISKCWSSLYSRIDEIKNKVENPTAYGFQDYSRDFDILELSFYYIAGVEVSSLDYIPEGMAYKTIPASKYAVFTHEGSKKDIGTAIRNIYNRWFSDFELELNDEICGDFELYPKGWDCNTEDCIVDIYIPIK